MSIQVGEPSRVVNQNASTCWEGGRSSQHLEASNCMGTQDPVFKTLLDLALYLFIAVQSYPLISFVINLETSY